MRNYILAGLCLLLVLMLQAELVMAYTISHVSDVPNFFLETFGRLNPSDIGIVGWIEGKWKTTFYQSDCPSGTVLVTPVVDPSMISISTPVYGARESVSVVDRYAETRLGPMGNTLRTELREEGLFDKILYLDVYEKPKYLETTHIIQATINNPPSVLLALDADTGVVVTGNEVLVNTITICD